MGYINYLKEQLGNDIIITKELNMAYNGEETLVIVKYLSGNNYKESTIQPVQLVIYTTDLQNTKALFDSFTKAYTNVYYRDGLNYVRQFYSTPVVLGTSESANNYVTQLIISGTLVISENVSEIEQVFIDGEEVETTDRVLSYASSLDNHRKVTDMLSKTFVRSGALKFNCTMINKGNDISNKIRGIRRGSVDINTLFNIRLVFNDGETEVYNMKLDSATMNSNNQNLPILSLSFVR